MYAVMTMVAAVMLMCALSPALLAWGNAGVKRGGKPGPCMTEEMTAQRTERAPPRVRLDVLG